jgi:hypothetical protein
MGAPVTELGIIEGYYGRPWEPAAREETMRALAPAGYRFYLHARRPTPSSAAAGRRSTLRRPPTGSARFPPPAAAKACASASA